MKNDGKRHINKYYVVALFFIIFLGYYSYRYIRIGLRNSYDVVTVNYQSKSDIDYKVYLIKNNFFTEPYLGMDRTYIASLIDYLEVNFNYTLDFDKPITGYYQYYIKATISADKENSTTTNYWSKAYYLKELETLKIENEKSIVINPTVKIDYQQYSALLRDFRRQYSLSIDGSLKLELVVTMAGRPNDMVENAIVNSTSELSIPLTEQAIELSIDSDNESKSATLAEKVEVKSAKSKIFIGFGILFIVMDIVIIIICIRDTIKKSRSQSYYTKELKKILTTYDGIIVNTKNIPNLDKYKSIYVDSFQELIDAHSEVRLPINYIIIRPGSKCKFVLINNDIAWIYQLEDKKVSTMEENKELKPF